MFWVGTNGTSSDVSGVECGGITTQRQGVHTGADPHHHCWWNSRKTEVWPLHRLVFLNRICPSVFLGPWEQEHKVCELLQKLGIVVEIKTIVVM